MRIAIRLAVLAAVCSAVLVSAQTQSGGKKYQLLPSLDKQLMDTTADPCVDFFQYSCGNFGKLYPIPNDRSAYGTGSIIAEYTQHEVQMLLEKAAAGGADRTASEQKIGDYYAACLDTDTINKKGLAPLQADLKRIDALKSKEDLPQLLGYFQLIGVNAFLGFGEQQDFKDARKQIAVVDQAGLGLPERDYYLRTGAKDEELRQQYVQHITNTLKLMGESESQAAGDAQAIMKLETALAKASLDITSQRDPNKIYHMTSVADLEKLAPAFDWKKFFMAGEAPSISELNVTYPPFFQGLNEVLASTDLPTIKAYLRWQLVHSMPGWALPKAFDDEAFDFNGHKLSGQPEQRARWKRCSDATDNAMGEAVGQVYVAKNFPPSSKAATVQMVNDIETAMGQDIETLDWMSPETKKRAQEKLHAVADKIGYPDHWRDYTKLEVVRDDAYGNVLRATAFEARRQLAKIGKPVDRGEWGMSPATVNAYYNPSMNDINFPAAILQSPLYSKDAPDVLNYGHIGGVVGHELTHGFDDEGRQFDANGNLSDWWTAEDAKKFEAKAECEVKEYDSFVPVDDLHVNGKLTLGENTADNGGLRLALIAFLADAKRKNIDLDQKEDGFTMMQLFFLAHGQSWCGETRPEQVRLQVQTDPHSPRKFRVNGVVQNMPEFGKAFGCKVGQPMMPENACRVW